MQNTIYNYIDDTTKNTGLILVDPPTGYGKTYMAAQSIYNYARKSEGNKKIFFVTTLIKNLPVDELRKVYKEHGEEHLFESDVLVIKSNYDFVYENLLELDIPEQFQTKSYFELCDKLVRIKKLEKKKDSTFKEVISDLASQIKDKYEKNFRSDIKRIIKEQMPKKKSARLYMIRNNKEYQWIGKLYPTVFTNDYQVYLLTMDKFLVRNTVLVEPSYEFLKNEITNNAIVFIDEFDATKATIQGYIIKKALDAQDDYIRLFEQIYKTIWTHRFPQSMIRPYKEYLKEREDGVTLENLKHEAKEIYEQFYLRYSYKTTAESVDRKQSFLFNDNSYHTMLRNNRNYIRVTPNTGEQQVQIFFEDKEDYEKNKSENDLVIYGLIRTINSFLNRLRYFVFAWSYYYAKSENEKRTEQEDEFTMENAMCSLYKELSLTERQIQIMLGDIVGTSKHKDTKTIPDMSFYENGFKYFEFVDSDAHLGRTQFNHVQILDTPEKIILFLAQKSKVIALSATAILETVIGNYDLVYLAKELGTSFQKLEGKLRDDIKADLETRWEFYRNGTVDVQVDILDYNKGNVDLETQLKELFTDRDIVKLYSMEIMTRSGGSRYIWQRYCNMFRVIKVFMEHDDIKSFLCLNSVLPEYNRTSFDLELLKKVASEFAKNCHIEEYEIVVLKSDNFDLQKDEVLEKLSKGKKILIFSSYKTIGAGQNLQYDVPDNQNIIRIFDAGFEGDSRIKKKDMDAIYLGDITHIIANAYDKENFGKAEMLDFFFEAEYLYQNDEISFDILNRLIKQGFKSYSNSGETDKAALSQMRKCQSVAKSITRDVIQAIGRMCRTFNKNAIVYIFTTEELLAKMDVSDLEELILSPEMETLIECKNNMKPIYTKETETYVNKAARISTQGKTYIRRMLSRDWTERSMELWQKLRECVLKFPTSHAKNMEYGNVVEDLYIENKELKSDYLFAQKGDFSDVTIDYDNDRIVFEEKVKYQGKRVSSVNEEESRLQQILLYPGMKEYFVENGWATNFGNEEKIISPILFQNIYKGALGEVAGKFILKKELGIELKEITDPEKFEFFDYEVAEGIYVDFKHWKYGYPDERAKKQHEIRNKLKAISGKQVFIINVVADEQWGIRGTKDGEIIEIPRLIDNDGVIDKKTIKYLKGAFDEYIK